MMLRFIAWLHVGSAACVLLLAAGCAIPPRPPAEPASMHIARNGRFAVRYADAQGEARDLYGHFSWRENGQRVSLHLSNPLGQTLALIQSEPSSASLKVPGHALQTAPHMEDLMQNALGFALPISALRHWIHAMAAPEARALIQSGPNGGHALRIQQDGWTDYILCVSRQIHTADGSRCLFWPRSLRSNRTGIWNHPPYGFGGWFQMPV